MLQPVLMESIQFPLISVANPAMLHVFYATSVLQLASNVKMYRESIIFIILMAVF